MKIPIRQKSIISLFVIVFLLSLSTLNAQKIKVFILAGQSNMQGHGNIDPATANGTLASFMDSDSSSMFDYIRNDDGTWATRSDVWVRYDHQNGQLLKDVLKVGYGGYSGQIGPELGFGHLMGQEMEDQVYIIKTCWGGKSLVKDFRPPSSGGDVGPYYTEMIDQINFAITNIASEFPAYNNEEIEIAGFCWFQGWNDGEKDEYMEEYKDNLINLIKDVRTDLNLPDLPFLVGLTGIGGYQLMPGDLWVQGLQQTLVPAQIAAAEYSGHKYVTYADTRPFWRDGVSSPAPSAIHHWRNNAESYLKIGHEFGIKMLELMDIVNSSSSIQSNYSKIEIFPSPSHDFIQVVGQDDLFSIRVIDSQGKRMIMKSNVNPESKIDIKNLSSGLYFIELFNRDNKKIGWQKFIKG